MKERILEFKLLIAELLLNLVLKVVPEQDKHGIELKRMIDIYFDKFNTDNSLKFFRVGKKQGRVILDERSREVATCPEGKEETAQLICNLLNNHYKNGTLND